MIANDDPSATPVAPAPQRRHRLAWTVGVLLCLVVLLPLLVVLGIVGALSTPGGTAALLRQVPGVQVTSPAGSLLGGDFSAARIGVRVRGRDGAVAVEGLSWHGLHVSRGAGRGLWLRIDIDRLQARRIAVDLPPDPNPPAATPLQPPSSLRLPVELAIGQLGVDTVEAAALGAEPVRGVSAHLHLGDDGGARHHVDGLSAGWAQLAATTSASIGADAPFALTAQLAVATAAPAASAASAAGRALPREAQLHIEGPLARLVAVANVGATVTPAAGMSGTPAASAASAAGPTTAAPGTGTAPSLQAHAVLTPFASWPIAELRADAVDFDAAAWLPAAPHTGLTGSARVDTTGYDRPAEVTLDLRNAAAGRWDTGRLPLTRLQGKLVGTPGRLDRIDLQALTADLGTANASAGVLSGSGSWTPARAAFDLALADVQPAALDARAPAMRLGGSVRISATPSSSASASASASAPITSATAPSSTAPAASAAASVHTEAPGPLAHLHVRADIDGTLADSRVPGKVALQVDADADADRIEVHTARVGVGTATATLAGHASRSAIVASRTGTAASTGHTTGDPTAVERWDIDAQAGVDGMDPFVWWPGAAPAGRRAGPTRLQLAATARLRGVDIAAIAAPAAWLPELQGTASLDVAKSSVLGVPVAGAVSLRRTGNAPAAVTAHVDAAGNTLDAAAQVDLASFAASSTSTSIPASVSTRTAAHPRPGPAAPDTATFRIAAPDLTRLAALWPLVGTADTGGGQLPLQGSVAASGSARGHWPTLTTEGNLDATALRVGTARVQQAHGRWSLGTAPTAPADVQLVLGQASVGAAAAESVDLQLRGTAREHALTLRGTLQALPPAWVDAVRTALVPAATPASSAQASAPPATTQATADAVRRTTLALTAHGGLVDAGGGFGGWRGTLAQVDVAAGAAPLVHTENVAIDYRSPPADAASGTGAAQVTVQPGRLDALGAALRWTRIDWRAGAGAGGRSPRLDGRVDLDPIRVAPILAVVQPGFGWGGDLVVAGHAEFHSTPVIGADVVIERRGGDLTVTEAGDDGETRALALTTLRIALTAQDGVWRFTPAIAGNALGVVAGAVTAHAAPQDLWPAPASPLDGVVTLAVGDLGNLGNWVPAGWRLRGALRAAAHVGGTVGAPTYTGELQGTQLGVRNFLQGVDVTDGDIAATLRGTTATIDHFTARAGGGTLRIDGGMSFGAQPQAQLNLTASKFQVLGRVDRRIVASGNARVVVEDDAHVALTGGFAVDEGLIDFSHSDAPTRSADVHVRRGDQTMWSQKEIEEAQNADSALSLRNVALDLRLSLGNALRLKGHGFQSGLAGDLRIRSPNGQLAFDGTVRTTDGTYNAYGQKLAIDRGDITFTGSPDNPRLDVQAIRPDLDTRVGVAITGTALAPKVRLFSEPDLSDIDKISMLMLGHASDGLGGSDMALLQSAALGLVSGEGGGEPGTSEKFTKALGLDALSVRQGSTNDVRDAVVSLGKQISQHWYVGYERGLGSAAGSVQLIYRLARRITLRAQSGSDNSIDAIWSWRWDKQTPIRPTTAPTPTAPSSTN